VDEVAAASAHWYDLERFSRLIAATVANDLDAGRETLVREFIATFRGMTRSDAQKSVLGKTGSTRMSLAELLNEGRNRKGVEALLKALQDTTKTVKPADLGVIGRDHLKAHCADAGGDLDTFGYHKATGTTDGLPWVLEAAFAFCPDADDADDRRVIAGCNWSPGIHNPFPDLDAVLSSQYVNWDDPIIAVKIDHGPS
jgi:hypothetical protein